MRSIVRLFIICLAISIAVAPYPISVSANAMQDILAKKAEIEQALQEIINYANSNKGERAPDPALELAIGRLEAHLKSIDFRLESLPACQHAPATPNTKIALDALKGLTLDQKGTEKRRQELDDKMREMRKRIRFLDFVEDATKKIVIVKGMAAAGSISLNAIPGMGTVFDAMGVLDSALSHMGINPLDPGAPQNVRGIREYRQYLGENKEAFQRYAEGRAQEYLRRNPNYRFTEQDIFWWAHKFVLDNTPKDKEAKKKEHEEAKKELDRLQRGLQGGTANNNYFAGLIGRFEAAIGDSKWIQDPKQFEKMKAEVKVTVVDDKTGTPLRDPNVSVSPNAGTQRRSGNPSEFEGVNKGSYTVKADAAGYVKDSTDVQVSDCKIYPIVVRLKKRPVITVADIRDEEGRLIDNVKVDIANTTGGASGGSKTYNRIPIPFIVDPGVFTVTATDIGDMYEPASVNANAEAGQETEVHLVMRTKNSAAFVVEVFDSLSGLKIDPPPGSDEPGALLEPLEGQPAPSRQPYAGNGELPFGSIRAGSYKYHVSLCGWESQSGTFTISPDELKTQRIVRRVSVKPRSLDSFTGNVIETGTDSHIDGFKVSLIGLGPRQGYRYDTAEGKDPDPNSHTLWGAFIIKGPIYSGRYRLVITRDCYKPLILDKWWTFCPPTKSDRGAFTTEILRIDATPEFEQARRQARALIAQMNNERQKARTAADQIQDARRKSQDLADLAGNLARELGGLKQSYSTLEQDCTLARNGAAEIKRISNLIQGTANRVTILRETAKNLAGVACQLSERAQQATDPATALNHTHNAGQFAKQTNKTAEEAKQLAEDMRRQLALVEQQDFSTLEQAASGLRRAFASSAGRLRDLRARLNSASQAATSLAQANAAVAEANRLLGTIQQLLQPCAANHPGKEIVENAQQVRNAVASEQKRATDENALLQTFFNSAQSSAMTADNLGREIEKALASCDGLKGIDSLAADAKATADAIDVFARAAGESAKAVEECSEKARQRITDPNNPINQINRPPAVGVLGAPTDEVPDVLGTDKPTTQPPSDEVPPALGEGPGFWNRTKEKATADVPPALGDGGFWERTKAKAAGTDKPINQPPTDDVPIALGGPTRPLGAPRPPFNPPGETNPGSEENQTPTDEVPGALGSNRGQPPTGDADDEQPGGKKENKPRDPNKPSKAAEIGKLIGTIGGVILSEIQKQKQKPGVASGGSGGSTGDGPTGTGGTTGGGSAGGLEGTEWNIRYAFTGGIHIIRFAIRGGQVVWTDRADQDLPARPGAIREPARFAGSVAGSNVRLEWSISPEKSPDGKKFWSTGVSYSCALEFNSSNALNGTCTVYGAEFTFMAREIVQLPPKTERVEGSCVQCPRR